MWNQAMEKLWKNCGINRFIDYLMVIDTLEILWSLCGIYKEFCGNPWSQCGILWKL